MSGGASAPTRFLKRLELITGPGITFGNALATVGYQVLGDKFQGVWDEHDKLPDLRPGTGLIINKPHNQHWIARYRDATGHLHTFDSYGRNMGPNPVKPPADFKQKDGEMDCGSRCLAWLFDKIGGK